MQIGDKVSIYSEKSFQTENTFEAIGNVIILSGNETLYGEKASYDSNLGEVKVEGNVRYITGGMTIYGSHMYYNLNTQYIRIQNARILTAEFNIVSKDLEKVAPTIFQAKDAEFTTCKDCAESWSIFGEDIVLEMNRYVKIKNALIKVKAVSVLYLPYIVLPVKSQRESGLLFPEITSRSSQGFSYSQPYFWAIDESKDATFAPIFWARRGQGMDLQYRQAFAEKSWFEFDSRTINDKIYRPNEIDDRETDTRFFRHFTEAETHIQWNNSITQHIRLMDAKDLDLLRDQPLYMDDRINGSEIHSTGFLEGRTSMLNLGLRFDYGKNMLFDDAIDFDTAYVQNLPTVYFNSTPIALWQSEMFLLKNITVGFNSDYSVFRQMQIDESRAIRNTQRLNFQPYLDWTLFTEGPFTLKTNYLLDYQQYEFFNIEEDNKFKKSSGLITTEFSFSLDRIYGLAYEKKIPREQILNDETLNKQEVNKANLISLLPRFEDKTRDNEVTIVKNSYRHSQEYRFIHHFISETSWEGNEQFYTQIQDSVGWFDQVDSLRDQQASSGSFQTSRTLDQRNTLELQWNNILIRKSPKFTNYLVDDRYLKDNFNYHRVAFFNVSQGFMLGDEEEFEENRLTRLHTHAGYNMNRWSFALRDYYFHNTTDHILTTSIQKNFDFVNLLTAYTYNSFPNSNLKTLKLGAQLRPVETVGLSVLREDDLVAQESIRSIYQFDLMPNNNCWIMSFKYIESVVAKEFVFNVVFNFGDDSIKEFKQNFYRFDRL